MVSLASHLSNTFPHASAHVCPMPQVPNSGGYSSCRRYSSESNAVDPRPRHKPWVNCACTSWPAWSRRPVPSRMVSVRLSDKLIDLGSGRCTSAPITVISSQEIQVESTGRLFFQPYCVTQMGRWRGSRISRSESCHNKTGVAAAILLSPRVLSGAELTTCQTFGWKDEWKIDPMSRWYGPVLTSTTTDRRNWWP